MRAISKGSEPISLTAHRKKKDATYANYGGKDDIRRSLVEEQGGICCYCMGRIRPDETAMKIEHWRCQDRYDDLQLHYGNLLGACKGGEGLPPTSQHCDTYKGNKDLRWNPADAFHAAERTLFYNFDGEVRSSDPDFNTHLDSVLHLNIDVLKNGRKAVLDGIHAWWQTSKERRKGPVPRDVFEHELRRRLGDGTNLSPYCHVAVWWLRYRLEKMK